ncbi:MAG: hypothetical protein IT507_11815 [Burkholderiaceae bacterium]|nr:hypothetical protein [Burkholderiaceae bacterium]
MNVEQTLPEALTPRERARQVACLLADAIARLQATRPPHSDIALGFVPAERVHTNPSKRRGL